MGSKTSISLSQERMDIHQSVVSFSKPSIENPICIFPSSLEVFPPIHPPSCSDDLAIIRIRVTSFFLSG